VCHEKNSRCFKKTKQKTINNALEYKLNTKHEEASQNKTHHTFKLQVTILTPDVATALPCHKMWTRNAPVFTSAHKFEA
jgi:hypothetical protein